MTGQLRRRREYPGWTGANPFGAPASGNATATSYEEAVARARWIALDVSADRFALFVVARSARRTTLSPRFDTDFPAVSLETRHLVAQFGDQLAAHVRTSAVPIYWTNAESTRPSIADLHLMQEFELSPARMSSVAFPVYADGDLSGLLVLSGSKITIGEEQLFETHSRAFALFHTVVGQLRQEGGSPNLSKRELDCLRLAADGLTSEQIASTLGLSVHTANEYLGNATTKLNADNRMHAIAKALRLGLID